MDWQVLLFNDRVVAAFVTALVGGGVVALGWLTTHRLSRHRDKVLREERIGDIQRALLAEIRAHIFALEQQQDARAVDDLEAISDSDYLPILPHDANDRIFRAIVEEVHLLPEGVIDPVVRYYRLLAVRSALAQDIRNNAKDYPRRTALMFKDYLEITEETWDTGLEAVEILTVSVKAGPRLSQSRAKVREFQENRQMVMAQNMQPTMKQEMGDLHGGPNRRSSDRSDQ